MSLRKLFQAIVPVIALAAPLAAMAQIAPPPTGTIAGVVKDASGGLIPGAVVNVVNAATGVVVSTNTSTAGTYSVANLPPASYRVETSIDGFDIDISRVVVLAGQTATLDVTLLQSRVSEGVVVTARRIEEQAQEVPIPLSVVSGQDLERSGSFNVNRLKELIPTVQFYSTNPRNSSVQIRGLGAPFGLTNDGIEPGVGLYIDGVFYARPASATLDFLDVDRIEVLRGPQGTLFGKNTTAGAINVTTRKPSFLPGTDFELSYGSLGYIQAKGSMTGPIVTNKVAGRLSFSGTQRDGNVYNVKTKEWINDMNNLGVRGQVLYAPTDKVAVTFAVDGTRQRVRGTTQVIAGVAPTLRAANRQFANIAAEVGYVPPSYNAFDRVTDVDTLMKANQDLGGASVNLDWDLGKGRLTSTTAWRYWNWDPSNDRDFIGLPITTVSAGNSTQRQLTQEVRYAGDISTRASFVVGAFFYRQNIDSDPVIKQEQGASAARWLLAPSANAATPGLLDGYGYDQYLDFDNRSSAVFGQVEFKLTDRLRLLPGLRFNYDQKKVDFDQVIYGGLQTNVQALINLQRSLLAPQAYTVDIDDSNTSGQFSAAYKITQAANAYATYATSFKSVGLNLGGVPTDAADQPVLSAATVKPERVHHIEAGIKTEFRPGVTANVTVFNTEIKDYQTQVQNAAVGILRGYLANAAKVRVRGVEFDGTARINDHARVYSSLAYTDGKYISFVDAPSPLEETGGPGFKDISGSVLPGISKWAVSCGGELSAPGPFLGHTGEFFGAVDASYRSDFSSSPSASQYLIVPAYALVNLRVGFRTKDNWTITLWGRNILDKDYYDLLSPVTGGTGLYVGQPGDQRTFGVTLRVGVK